MRAFNVCNECSTAIANNDYSGVIDYYNLSEDEANAIYSSVEYMGMAIMREEWGGGYFRCFVCNDDTLDGYVWENDSID